ncbi:lytic transglycosylase domain-containing protein [Agrobacterium tumefaciens]|uniref:lytic transglycosylase domain-containing protein n=1 Tax=Agrobacterium tumefaciens TaxID=358 RepID=UPI002244A61D|nr:lytic transglycosylase domain-containing protein [Agrobacterium tumefaciens]MCW8146234.1 lytic transglycosylase domain-containing protein [Agrobacterium tumefaciens]
MKYLIKLLKSEFNMTNTYCVFAISGMLLVGQSNDARSAVFEQMDNGQIATMDGGVPEGTPSLEQGTAQEGEQPRMATSHVIVGFDQLPADHNSSVLLNLDLRSARPASRTSFSVRDGRERPLPEPRALSRRFSVEQHKMRELAAQVAFEFSRDAGVAKAGLDRQSFVKLFTTMIQRESNFNARAVSHAGASGLGQLMPATARAMGVCDVFSGRDNLEGAARYLTQMLDQFASSSLALAAYNAGPGAVQKYRGIPPYRETRQYVADIVHAVASQSDIELTPSDAGSRFKTGLATDCGAPDAPAKVDLIPA